MNTPLVLDSSEFPAIDADDAKIVLAAVMKASNPQATMPDAVRLIDPDGYEVWCALLATPK